ncbi:V-type proton ATPase subunit G of the V1 peripheral membrane domain [Komagataella phaffii CBS 7435]|uniref:V-type proton ATPase subunit G n=1 Tax=Komagataella phaffii (strain ATCC 76273 / CBS 7435 / CECT 11047 / NRRL Y-11430 / Wegner 21-1) TaxID=981350 RepID=F2QZS6_KOMPC|nr:V-type proton ATPase subunit G of the V1 peripheral membrane domain [Komagataella phaffii CBS 7435]CCA40904.1 V-type proton ATPase subunit G of the V1 peripheral membrane domain [Komagataella phaffii CBS 7435]
MSGVQTLLKAEKEAHEIVSAARQYRTQRLKEAKLDAAKDIKEYKQKKEKELKEHEAQFSGSNDDLEKAAESEVQTELVEIDKSAEAKKEDVVKLLLDAITHPKPELHVNARA